MAQRSLNPWPRPGSSDPLTHWGAQSSIHRQDKEPVFKQTRGMSAHTSLTAGTAVHAPTQRCICSHKAGEDKTSFDPQGTGAPLGRT